MDLLPINVEDLIYARTVEGIRIEYKSTFNEQDKWSTVATVAAFANDFHNLSGGYVILGINATNGIPNLPAVGIPQGQLDSLQRDIRVACLKISPSYCPLIIPAIFQEKHIIILWAPSGDNRPYTSPDHRNPTEICHYVRQGSETIKAQGDILRQLLELTARIPFDDRRSHDTSLLDISPILVKRFLKEVGSDLLNVSSSLGDVDLYKSMRVVADIQGTFVPKNIALLFFSEHPEKFFSGCVFEVVQFSDSTGGNLIEEKKFTGPLDNQITGVLDYLDTLTNVQLRKLPGKAEVERTVAYPYEALEEAIANAAYHRSYDNLSEPNKIYLYSDRVEIISYPGPVPGITLDHLKGSAPMPPVPARNRRIGEFLKELRLVEMRGTGIPKIKRVMSDNGSANPVLDFDPQRTFFRVVLPAHPKYIALHSLRESAYQWSIGEKATAVSALLNAHNQQPGSGVIAAQLMHYYSELDDLTSVEKTFNQFHKTAVKSEVDQPYLKYFKVLFFNNEAVRAQQVLDLIPQEEYLSAGVEIGIAYKRLKIYDKAHTIMSRILNYNDLNPDYLHNFAQVKMSIAYEMSHRRNPNWQTIRRLRLEAIELMKRSLSLYKDSPDKAWCFFNLARTLWKLRVPESQIREAFESAINLLPYEKTFQEAYRRFQGGQS